MIKIIKNATGSAVPVQDTGVTIPASGQYTIPPQDYLLWSASDNAVTLINAGTIFVNDGSKDLNKKLSLALLVDFDIRPQNVVYVSKNPSSNAEYTSIKDAINSVTTASVTNTFLVLVAPGVYTENNPIVMKSFVNVAGLLPGRSTEIVAQNAGSDLITAADSTFIRGCLLTGTTGSGASLIKYTAAAANGLFIIDRVRFGAADTLVTCTAGAYDSFLRINTCRLGEGYSFNKGFLADTTGAGISYIQIDNMFSNRFTSPYPSYVGYASGADCEIDFQLAEFETENPTPSGVFAQVDNGGHLDVFSVHAEGFDKCIKTINTGSAPSLSVSSIAMSGNNTDIEINHTGTTGSIFGIFEKTKVVNSAPNTVQLVYQDPTTGDFNISKIIATRGFATEINSIATAASTTTLISTDPHVVTFTGSTLGKIVKLPNATTLRVGHQFYVINLATVLITMQQFDGSNSTIINPQGSLRYVLIDSSTSAGVWARASTSASPYAGTTAVLASYGGNANTGRYLEVWPNLPSDVDPFVIPVTANLIGLVLGAEASSTGTLSVYKTSDLSTAIASISLVAQTEVINTGLTVPLAALDKLAFKISSGTVSKPRLAFYISGS